ncbi:MAG TPA: D-2-hydroxyacid dehydrogenase, partial [Verrucomicrobiales bacterium]|nr:D-2-hydroxyacid dehydrogenase [Verrucomicrobiales bacterium]
FSASRFSLMKQAAVFYNIGRGTTVDQEALADALESGHLAAAWLDVTDPEPLAQGHRLWSAPHCYITPHTAGGHTFEAGSLVRYFLGNLRRFERGERLSDQIMWA